MQIDRQALLEVFLAETRESLAGVEQLLVALEAHPGDAEALGEVFRAVHTLKGNAASLGFPELSRLAHAAEDLLDRVRRGALEVDGELITALLASRDQLAVMLEDAALGRAPDAAELQRAIEALASRAGGRTPAPAGPAQRALDGEGRPRAVSSLRVSVDKLDRLLALCGEIAVARLRVEAELERLGAPGRDALEALRDADGLHSALQELVLETRMVPLGSAFRQHERTVRDLAAEGGKRARLLSEGDEIEVDTSVVELVRDALTHMIRNAIDHGIERPERRAAAGKDPEGTVRLLARHEQGHVVIEVRDDGAGIDLGEVRSRALRAGLLAQGAEPTESELFDLLFLPGFTTAETVTGTSGRGVGMDVVRRNLARVRGSVRIESAPGAGTTIALRVPLTVATVEALRVEVAGETYVLPMEVVCECLDLEAPAGERAAAGVVELRGSPLPYLRLRHAIGAASRAAGRSRENVVVVRHDRGQAGLAVDAVLGSGHAVMRPLGRFLKLPPGVTGSVILGSGEVALVLDAPALVSRALRGRPDATEGRA